jgi:hypothetical protein
MINTKDITEGKLNGQMVWICDYRFDDYSNKPIRSIKPTQVLIRDNDETTKTIYYSTSHFIQIDSKGNLLKSKIIGVYDTTGYRSYPGIAVNCFRTKKECDTFYKKQINEAIKGLQDYKQKVDLRIFGLINEITNER